MLTTAQRADLLQRVAITAAPLTDSALGLRWPWDHEELERRCELISSALGRGGADEVALKTFAWGPEQRYFDWTGDRVPLVERAELWLQTGGGHQQLLCRASDEPACCLGAMRPTEGGEGELLEVVDAGYGTLASEYKRARVGTKVVLASGHQPNAAMHEALVARDAAGLLLGPGAATSVQPRRLSGPCLYATQRPFGFNLDAERYHLLLSRLAAGESLRVRVVTRIRSESGERPALLARLRGAERDDERVCLIADLSRGVASVNGAMRALSALRAAIVDGVLAPPVRGIELCLLGGDAAAVAWLADETTTWPTALLQLTVDERAYHTRAQTLHPSAGSFVDDLLIDELEACAELERPRVSPLRLSLPHRGPPAPGNSAHTDDNGLALDGVTPHAALLRSEGSAHDLAALGSALYELANLSVDQLPLLISRGELAGASRLERRARILRRHALADLAGDPTQLRAHACDQLWQIERGLRAELERERERLASAAAFFGGVGGQALALAETEASLDRQRERLTRVLTDELRARVGEDARLTVKRRALTALERRASNTFYARRSAAGPIPVKLLLRNARPADQAWLVHHEHQLTNEPSVRAVLQALRGERRSLLELWEQLRDDYPQSDLKLFGRLLEVLEGAELVASG